MARYTYGLGYFTAKARHQNFDPAAFRPKDEDQRAELRELADVLTRLASCADAASQLPTVEEAATQELDQLLRQRHTQRIYCGG